MAEPLAPWLEQARAAGLDRQDPLTWAVVEGLCHRAARADGARRDALLERARQHVDAMARRTVGGPQTPPSAPRSPGRLALQDLLSLVERPRQTMDRTPLPTAPPNELRALSAFRQQWSRLALDEQLERSLASLPANAGPLHSSRLAIRTLQRLRGLSPDMLTHFVRHVQGLQALHVALAPPSPAVQRPRSRG